MSKSHICYSCDKKFKNSRSLATHNNKFHTKKDFDTTASFSNDRCEFSSSKTHDHNPETQVTEEDLDFENIKRGSLFSESSVSSLVQEASIKLALDELKDIIRDLETKTIIQDQKLRDLDCSIFRLELQQQNDSPTDESKLQNEVQTKTILDLQRKVSELEDAWEEHLGQSSLTELQDLINIQHLFRENNINVIKQQLIALKNAVSLVLERFDIPPNLRKMLQQISEGGLQETKKIVNEKFSELKSVFTSLSLEDQSGENDESEAESTDIHSESEQSDSTNNAVTDSSESQVEEEDEMI